MADTDENKIYVGDTGLAIVLDCGEDITGATDTVMYVKKPDGTFVTWTAEVLTVSGETRYLRYYTQAGDLDTKGRWRIQAGLTVSGWTGRGETTTFRVYDVFK